MTNKQMVMAALSPLHAADDTVDVVLNKAGNPRKKNKTKTARLMLVAIVAMVLLVTAVAGVGFSSKIQEWFNRDNKLSEEVQSVVYGKTEAVYSTVSDKGITIEIKEMFVGNNILKIYFEAKGFSDSFDPSVERILIDGEVNCYDANGEKIKRQACTIENYDSEEPSFMATFIQSPSIDSSLGGEENYTELLINKVGNVRGEWKMKIPIHTYATQPIIRVDTIDEETETIKNIVISSEDISYLSKEDPSAYNPIAVLTGGERVTAPFKTYEYDESKDANRVCAFWEHPIAVNQIEQIEFDDETSLTISNENSKR